MYTEEQNQDFNEIQKLANEKGISASEILDILMPEILKKRADEATAKAEAEAEAARRKHKLEEAARDDADAHCASTLHTSAEERHAMAVAYLKEHHPDMNCKTARYFSVDLHNEYKRGVEMIEELRTENVEDALPPLPSLPARACEKAKAAREEASRARAKAIQDRNELKRKSISKLLEAMSRVTKELSKIYQ